MASEAWGSRPSHFMIIPNTKRHPNNTKTDQLPIFGVISGLQGHTSTLAHPDEPHMQKMSRRCGSSKPTPTPLNGLALKPGKTRRKIIEGNADTIIRQITHQKPAAYRQYGGGRDKKARRQDKPSKPSRVPSAWRGGARRRKAN